MDVRNRTLLLMITLSSPIDRTYYVTVCTTRQIGRVGPRRGERDVPFGLAGDSVCGNRLSVQCARLRGSSHRSQTLEQVKKQPRSRRNFKFLPGSQAQEMVCLCGSWSYQTLWLPTQGPTQGLPNSSAPKPSPNITQFIIHT
jgi:hypothetical protein